MGAIHTRDSSHLSDGGIVVAGPQEVSAEQRSGQRIILAKTSVDGGVAEPERGRRHLVEDGRVNIRPIFGESVLELRSKVRSNKERQKLAEDDVLHHGRDDPPRVVVDQVVVQ